MSTITATGWSGLVNDVHSTTYATVGEVPPKDGVIENKMQKRGSMGVAEAAGGTVQESRSVIDASEGNESVKGSIGNRDVTLTNTRGGDRGNALVNTATILDATGLAQLFDTHINHAYVADLAGNGGAALAAGTPNANQV